MFLKLNKILHPFWLTSLTILDLLSWVVLGPPGCLDVCPVVMAAGRSSRTSGLKSPERGCAVWRIGSERAVSPSLTSTSAGTSGMEISGSGDSLKL